MTNLQFGGLSGGFILNLRGGLDGRFTASSAGRMIRLLFSHSRAWKILPCEGWRG